MKKPKKSLPIAITQLSAVHISGDTYTVIMKVNSGLPVGSPPPAYIQGAKEIDWNLENLRMDEEATGSIDINFYDYSSAQTSGIYITGENSVRQKKGGVVIKQTDFPPKQGHVNTVETEALKLKLLTLTKNGSNFNLHLSFTHVKNKKYREHLGFTGPLTEMIPFGHERVLAIKLVEDATADNTLNINYVIPQADISSPIAIILTTNVFNPAAEYHKCGRFHL